MSTLNEATQWAQANPNDPRAKGVLAKAWAMQNPSDPRSAQILQKLEQSVQQSQNPQQIPDAADKAAQGGRPDAKPTMGAASSYTSPGESPTAGGWNNFKSRVSDPNRWHAILNNEGPAKSNAVGDSLGAASLAIPAEAAPTAISNIASYLGGSGVGSAMARVGTNAALGAATGAYNNDKDRLGGAAMGAAVGGGLSGLGEGISGIAQLGGWGSRQLARMTAPQAEAYLDNPAGTKAVANMLEDPSQMPELQDQAVSAINNSRAALKGQGLANASTLRGALEGKTINIDPSEYRGLDPRVDELLTKAARQTSETGGQILGGSASGMPQAEPSSTLDSFKSLAGLENPIPPSGSAEAATQASNPELLNYEKNAAGLGPSTLDMDANTVNQIKRYLQEGAGFAQGTVTDPVQAARAGALAQKASGLRASIEQTAPEAEGLNKQMQEGLLLQSALRKGAKSSPLAFISSESPDRIATLARAENSGAGGMLDFGNKLGAAKTMTRPDQGSGIPTFLTKLGGRGLMRFFNGVESTADTNPIATQAIIQGLFDNQEKK